MSKNICEVCGHHIDSHDPFDVTHSFGPRGKCMHDGCECEYFEPLSADDIAAIDHMDEIVNTEKPA